MDITRVAAWGVAAILAVIAVTRVSGGDDAAAPTLALDEPAGAAATASAAPAEAQEPGTAAAPAAGVAGDGALHVHVAGAVRRPGVYRVPAGSRVVAAIDAAGGLARRADATGVNLAAPLQDGQQVVVPERGRGGTRRGGVSAGATAVGDGTISLNTATAEELEALDGIGPALARRIVEYREAHGGFRSVDELLEVDGIGEKRLAAIRDDVGL